MFKCDIHLGNIRRAKKSGQKKDDPSRLLLSSSYGNRTHDSAVRGQRLNPLTNEPCMSASGCFAQRKTYIIRCSIIMQALFSMFTEFFYPVLFRYRPPHFPSFFLYPQSDQGLFTSHRSRSGAPDGGAGPGAWPRPTRGRCSRRRPPRAGSRKCLPPLPGP